ncbi:hypothetical protein QZH41_004938 [Actinostola sp. cb2023]|nr:hypothetical protein QZH41_004938 [Actinostola sp. cb2023]
MLDPHYALRLQIIIFDSITNAYFPLLYLNNYWNLGSDYMPINETTPALLYGFTPGSWQMYESQRVRQKWFSMLGDDMSQSEEEQDTLKSIVVLLYVIDNDTNTMVIISIFVGLLIEIWKINKVVDIKLDMVDRWLGIFPRLKFTDKRKLRKVFNKSIR